MQHCLNHPEVGTARRCEVCQQPFCDACLELYEPIGPVCAECEAVLEKEDQDRLPERLPALRQEVQRTLPPERPWWGWDLMFWTVVALPSLVALFYLAQLFQYHQVVAVLSQEPTLPGKVTARLTEVGAALERHRAAHGTYPAALTDLKPPELSGTDLVVDLYSPQEEKLLYTVEGDRYQLCSRGPDRTFSQGSGLDRFSGSGDLCLAP